MDEYERSYLRGLEVELGYYLARGDEDRAAAVRAEIARLRGETATRSPRERAVRQRPVKREA